MSYGREGTYRGSWSFPRISWSVRASSFTLVWVPEAMLKVPVTSRSIASRLAWTTSVMRVCGEEIPHREPKSMFPDVGFGLLEGREI
jgi:hypothetical protein